MSVAHRRRREQDWAIRAFVESWEWSSKRDSGSIDMPRYSTPVSCLVVARQPRNKALRVLWSFESLIYLCSAEKGKDAARYYAGDGYRRRTCPAFYTRAEYSNKSNKWLFQGSLLHICPVIDFIHSWYTFNTPGRSLSVSICDEVIWSNINR